MVWDSWGREAIHTKMEKQVFAKQVFAGPCEDIRATEGTLISGTHLSFPCPAGPGYAVLIYGDSPLPRMGPLSEFF